MVRALFPKNPPALHVHTAIQPRECVRRRTRIAAQSQGTQRADWQVSVRAWCSLGALRGWPRIPSTFDVNTAQVRGDPYQRLRKPVTLLETAYPEPMLLGVVKRAERDAVAEIITASTPRFHARPFHAGVLSEPPRLHLPLLGLRLRNGENHAPNAKLGCSI